MNSSLYKELYHYDEKNIYPFHMPGHKRNPAFLAGFFPVRQDITEITGFDDLHRPQGLIKEAEYFAAELFGSRKAFFSVNGSTAAILSAVSAAVRCGGKMIVSRNSHKSLYNALYLRNIDPVYVYPEIDENTGISLSIMPLEVKRLLDENKDIEAVFITSPTYDGVVSDVRAIAEEAHKYGIPLIVDEAHGAHFSFSDYFPDSAVNCGADLVIQSIHKTLPAMTQTALLHNCTDRVSLDKIRRFMSIYQTSSPSYPLMSSLDHCFHFLKETGRDAFEMYTERLDSLRNSLKGMSRVRLMEFDRTSDINRKKLFDYDRSKILLTAGDFGITGTELLKIFHNDYGLEMESAASDYVIALTSVGDSEEGFQRLYLAAADLEKKLPFSERRFLFREYGEKPCKIMRISEAMDSKARPVCLEDSIGKISAEFMYLYPPGIPMIAPGERITLQFVQNMRRYMAEGMNIAGMKDCSGKTIECVM